ncbi:LacI family DNA-binding transcriptional regulator [Pseudoduganella namucuonensis]|uniref:Transcriptional regulator, LacI family n=1 Tax=Pseudoduganella namucuonensis TaxID=1035707 RepID=A0A1I7JXF0_9BURK|nr:LacI family DNA-binding transcriptional regulator [Pseudoduganella namucuonensis]SFU89836.1 transcriptional regulator, LacI family [Pseudoduganella namucuonensis]
MADIARLANVSVSTVSRALANNPRLSEETRSRINELAKSLNYSINVGAQILKGKPLRTVAVAFPYHSQRRQHFKDPFFLALLGAIGDALIDSGHSMLVVGVEEARSGELLQAHETGQAIGTIMLGQEYNHELFNELAVRGMPFVVWGARLSKQLYCTVGSDNAMGGRQATEHLLRQGARRIAFFGDRRLPELGLRYEGYLQAHADLGLDADPALYRPVPFVEASVQAEVERMLREKTAFDAVFSCSDVVALTVMSTLRDGGLRVPQDVMVTGFDDIRAAAQSNPPLTTVRQSIEEAGRILVALLLETLGGRRVESVVLPTELLVRQSTVPGATPLARIAPV